MKFAVGYQRPENGEPFPALIQDYREHVAEVYFPWVGAASGRSPLGGVGRGGRDWSAQAVLEDDLAALRSMGIRLDLLFNANCYGGEALSETLADEIGCIIDHLVDCCDGPDVVTTTSPFVAHVVKTRFPGLETRASVNMRIGTLQAMDYASEAFDGFYLQRDRQRNPDYVRTVHDWCRGHGKQLCLLVNSGCLRCCPGQTFHDNAVAHEAEIGRMRNLPDWNPHLCWRLYRDPARWVEFLKSTWIRPEAIARYEGLVDLCKLATRQHSHPRMVLDAYTRGRFAGDLMNLMEPCFAPAFAPHYLDNAAFPEDWADRTAECDGDCGDCTYCATVFQQVCKTYGEET